ncbi:GNAT family N-acetyltransferase [Streptomyces kronopolitis]|uniref:GNAT family N-acetyltransferase n=1 Tax=Streptomyces kronopolitis TaxID=1612435 RepID=UPI003D97A608
MSELRTERLTLREWRASDLGPWAAMNADPEVRAHFPEVLSRERSEASAARFQTDLARRGWGWWAVEVRATGEFIGFTGLDPVDDGMPFTGVEAGWRLTRAAWGHGYATEAGRAVLDFGFDTLRLPQILAVTTAANLRSRAVMGRLGMTRDPAEDFDDPEVGDGPRRPCVVYRVSDAAHRRNARMTNGS